MKKALTALVPTSALLCFAIVLGIAIISWGSSYKPALANASCEEAGISLVKVAGAPKICHSQNSLVMTAENDGSAGISSLLFDVIGSKSFQQLPSSTSLGVGEIKQISISFNPELGDIQKIKIVPLLKSGNSESLCPKKGYEVEQIGKCG